MGKRDMRIEMIVYLVKSPNNPGDFAIYPLPNR